MLAKGKQISQAEAESADHLLPDTVFVKETTSHFNNFQICLLGNQASGELLAKTSKDSW